MATDDLVPSDLPEDPCALELDGEYDKDMHVGAIFIILGCSLLGSCAPTLTTLFKSWKLKDNLLTCGKLFGGGVLLSTGFIHMMLPAFEAFSNTECLPKAFEDYEGYAGLIALFTLLTVHFLQTVAHSLYGGRCRTSARPIADKDVVDGGENMPLAVKPANNNTNYTSNTSNTNTTNCNPSATIVTAVGDHQGHDHGALLLLQEKRVIAYAVEFGVATHSVIIGITLGVARAEFTTLLAALCVHQFFEGLALSTIIREAEFKSNIPVILMILFYSLTTPIGVAIGVGINESFNENSQSALIVYGVLDSMSAGILIYDALVNIIMAHFQSPGYQCASLSFKSAQLLALWLGAAVMAVIGKYA